MWSTSNNAVQEHVWNSYTHEQQIPSPKSYTESQKADAPVTTRHPADQRPWTLVAALPLSSGDGPVHQSPSRNRVSWQPQVKSMTISSQAMRRSRQVLTTRERMSWVTADKIKHYGGSHNTGFKSENKVHYWPRQEKITCSNWSKRPFPSVDPVAVVLDLPLPLPLPLAICASLYAFTWCEDIHLW